MAVLKTFSFLMEGRMTGALLPFPSSCHSRKHFERRRLDYQERQGQAWSPGQPTPELTYLQIYHPRHHQGGHQQVRHGQAHHQVVGGGLQGPFPQHSHTHQTIAKDDDQDERTVGEGIISMWAGPSGTCGVVCPTGGVDVATQLTQRCHSPEGEEWPQWVSWENKKITLVKSDSLKLGCLHAYFDLLLQTIFIEHFLYARHHSKH